MIVSCRKEAIPIARPNKIRCICSLPPVNAFSPSKAASAEALTLALDEYEVVRLLDHMHYTQQQCAQKMGVSRATVARLHEHALGVLARMLVEGRPLKLEGGDVNICLQMRPECVNEPSCCHRKTE